MDWGLLQTLCKAAALACGPPSPSRGGCLLRLSVCCPPPAVHLFLLLVQRQLDAPQPTALAKACSSSTGTAYCRKSDLPGDPHVLPLAQAAYSPRASVRRQATARSPRASLLGGPGHQLHAPESLRLLTLLLHNLCCSMGGREEGTFAAQHSRLTPPLPPAVQLSKGGISSVPARTM